MTRTIASLALGIACALLGSCQSTTGETVTLVANPELIRDEWKTSSPADQGMDAAQLSKLREQLVGSAPAIRSVLVVRHGRIVFEHYAQGVSADDLQRVNSVTKGFTASLVGIAVQRGHIRDLDQRISDFFPETLAPDVQPKVRDVTIANLLTMTSGFEWDEQARDACTGSPVPDCARFRIDTDRVNYTIRRPVAHAPGQVFSYDSHGSHLLSILVARATRTHTAKFAEQHLFIPLGVHRYRWDTDPQGHSLGGSGLHLRPRDMAKFGQLYLKDGAWQGRQVLPAVFVQAATRKHAAEAGLRRWGTATSGGSPAHRRAAACISQ